MDKSQSLYTDIAACCLHHEVEKTTKNQLTIQARFQFPQSFSGFSGHFPGKPILPAIAQLAAVRYLANTATGQLLQPIHYSRTKFKSMVTPEEPLNIYLFLEYERECWQGSFRLINQQQESVATGKCQFR